MSGSIASGGKRIHSAHLSHPTLPAPGNPYSPEEETGAREGAQCGRLSAEMRV